jgi:hypothetical protein
MTAYVNGIRATSAPRVVVTKADEMQTDSSATVRLLEMTVRLLGVIAVGGLLKTQ